MGMGFPKIILRLLTKLASTQWLLDLRDGTGSTYDSGMITSQQRVSVNVPFKGPKFRLWFHITPNLSNT